MSRTIRELAIQMMFGGDAGMQAGDPTAEECLIAYGKSIRDGKTHEEMMALVEQCFLAGVAEGIADCARKS